MRWGALVLLVMAFALSGATCWDALSGEDVSSVGTAVQGAGAASGNPVVALVCLIGGGILSALGESKKRKEGR